MHILSSILLAFSSSIDSLIIGIAYGVKQIRIKFIINLFHIVLHGFLSSSSNFPLLGEVCYFSFKSRFLCWIHQTGQEIQRISWSVCNCSTLLKELKINHYKIRPRTPEHNG